MQTFRNDSLLVLVVKVSSGAATAALVRPLQHVPTLPELDVTAGALLQLPLDRRRCEGVRDGHPERERRGARRKTGYEAEDESQRQQSEVGAAFVASAPKDEPVDCTPHCDDPRTQGHDRSGQEEAGDKGEVRCVEMQEQDESEDDGSETERQQDDVGAQQEETSLSGARRPA